jgi:coproporphyrinogen III oxidase-like Fe-S oxidoreductase
VRTPERYLAAIEGGHSPIAATEVLDDDQRRAEWLQLAIRTRDGVPAGVVPGDVDELITRTDDGRVVLTVAGRLLANEVAVRLQ